MKRLYFFLLPAIAFTVSGFGQDDRLAVPRHQFKVSIFDMMDPFSPAFMMGYEQPIAKRFAFYAEGGPVSTFDGAWMMRKKMEGYKFRSELKWYESISEAGGALIYLGVQAMHKKTLKNRQDPFCVDDCTSIQDLEYGFENKVTAGHIIFGAALPVAKHFACDLGFFAGWRFAVRSRLDVPEGAIWVQREWDWWTVRPGRHSLPSLGASLRLGFGW